MAVLSKRNAVFDSSNIGIALSDHVTEQVGVVVTYVFGRWAVPNSIGVPATLTGGFCGFPHTI
jgi:hypothetical protein